MLVHLTKEFQFCLPGNIFGRFRTHFLRREWAPSYWGQWLHWTRSHPKEGVGGGWRGGGKRNKKTQTYNGSLCVQNIDITCPLPSLRSLYFSLSLVHSFIHSSLVGREWRMLIKGSKFQKKDNRGYRQGSKGEWVSNKQCEQVSSGNLCFMTNTQDKITRAEEKWRKNWGATCNCMQKYKSKPYYN